MKDVIIYTYSSAKYYECIERAKNAGTYGDMLKSMLPADWATSCFQIWVEARPPDAEIPDQGFKLHISASLQDAVDALKIIVPLLVKTRTSFKVLADPFFLRLCNSKRFPRAQSGKFVTVYPPNYELFCTLAQNLARATEHLHGPYILSDRRFGDKGIVYYRYGGFKRITGLQTDGTRRFLIKGVNGDLVPDERVPFFQLCKDIQDPFPDTSDVRLDDELLNSRYQVEEALNFTNTGGVYKATDLCTGSQVVLKEARPHTLLIAGHDLSRDAVEALRHECQCLQMLQSLPCVPRLIESFVEWEHHFLVESYISGTPLASLRAQDSFIIMENMYDREALIESCKTWRDIGLRLLDAVDSVHNCGVLLGDISPMNVLRNDTTGELTFIDLESASRVGDSGDAAIFNTRWSYPGFRSQHLRSIQDIGKLDDYYACGMLLYDLICPIQALFDLDRAFPRDRFLRHFVQAGLPIEMADVISKLWGGDCAEAMSTLRAFSPSDALTKLPKHPLHLTSDSGEPNIRQLSTFAARLSDTINELAQNILASSDTSREDRLWPSDAAVFQTNSLNLACGACGTAVFLKDALGTLPPKVAEWILRKEISVADYPPGLYTGLAGIAWSFAEFGWLTRAAEVMRLVLRSPIAFDSSTLFDGVAGWGLAALAIFATTQDDEFLAIAKAAGKHLVASRRTAQEGLYWMNEGDESPKLGMGFGGSGIALFLLYLWTHTHDDNLLESATAAMDFEVSHAKVRESDGSLAWPYSVGGQVYSPYWLRGSGGVASTLVRFHILLHDGHYLELARRAAKPCAGFFSVAPHLFEGLASMGETLLDLYHVTRERAYFEAAVLKARQILLYTIKENVGIAFPGRFLVRISQDYGTGGSGIGTFLQRVLKLGPRKFHELHSVGRMSANRLETGTACAELQNVRPTFARTSD